MARARRLYTKILTRLLLVVVVLTTLFLGTLYLVSPPSFHAHMIHWVFKDIPFIMRMYQPPPDLAYEDPIMDKLNIPSIEAMQETLSPMPFDDQVAYVKKHFASCDGKQFITEGIAPGSKEVATVDTMPHDDTYRFIRIRCDRLEWEAIFVHIAPGKGFFMGENSDFINESPDFAKKILQAKEKPLTLLRNFFRKVDGQWETAYFWRLPYGIRKGEELAKVPRFEIIPKKTTRNGRRIVYHRSQLPNSGRYRRLGPFHVVQADQYFHLPTFFGLLASKVLFVYYDSGSIADVMLEWKDDRRYYTNTFAKDAGCLMEYPGSTGTIYDKACYQQHYEAGGGIPGQSR